LLESESAKQVIERFKEGVLCAGLKFHADSFKALIGEVKNSTGVKGKELFHPIRIIVTGSHSGPEFDKLIPVIEEGSVLALPSHIPSVRERVERFFGG